MITVRPYAACAGEPGLRAALAQFEADFTYPLGEGERFRVDYGGAMAEFFRAQGDGAAWAAVCGGRCVGLLGAAVRPATVAAGPRRIATLGGLKARRSVAGALAFAALACTARIWLLERGAQSAFGVVLDGTARTPEQYTGRLWLPAFRPAGALVLLRFPRREAPARRPRFRDATPLADDYLRLPSAQPELRSGFVPREIRGAAGVIRLEDTRRAKRLYRCGGAGAELHAAHLGGLRAACVGSAADLIGRGLAAAWETGADCAFLSLPPPWWRALTEALQPLRPEVFGARIYTSGAPLPRLWPEAWDI